MKTTMFQTVTRRTAAVSRRGSIKLLGAAALTGALAAPAAAAKKNGKKDDQRCQRQRGQCLDFVKTLCAIGLADTESAQEGLETCEELYNPCCDHFARCDARQGLECFSGKQSTG